MTKHKRFSVLKRDNFTCRYCGKKSPEVKLEVDHIQPKSRGGSDDYSNLITACFECNNGKGVMRVNISKSEKDFILDGAGQICRKCNIPTSAFKRVNLRDETKLKAYYFNRYDRCKNCRTFYMIDSSKVVIGVGI